jgi:hypothetical protein
MYSRITKGIERPLTRRVCVGAALAGTVVLAATSAVEAAPKPGFAPGTWIGKGTISGRTSAGGGPTATFSGKLAFVVRVGRDRRVSGSGSWSRTMIGSGSVDAKIVAKAAVRVVGTSTAPRLVGSYRASGTFSGHGVSRATTFAPAKLDERLLITRAGPCRVTGRHVFRGVTTEWSAQLRGSGTCLA